ncbi:Zn-dependent oxidoreductase, NADPH:quinone reductase [Burkholderiales bacterium JOSHI_001]|nr:Zn-dependent oxidoreductase, NADPH:quinone reductase [Burkholderiales bacterium JOSHI_001]
MKGLELRSLVRSSGSLELSLVDVDVPAPGEDEVLVRMEAAPINPSDLGMLLAAADMGAAVATGTPLRPVVTAPIAPGALPGLAGRLDQSMPVGNEGAGVVVAAGASPAAQALLGRRVALLGGAMYTQFRCMATAQCLPLPADATSADGASCFVNPLTALGMMETMKREGHRALVHTAAASNLGQMLQRICRQDGIALVNIVRHAEQADLLRNQGALHVCCTASGTFMDELTDALAATGATLAFDATGGGKLAGQILTAMEAAIARNQPAAYSRYGSNVLKQVYIYGGLEPGPTELVRNFGFTWRLGGWLLFPFLQQLDPGRLQALKDRVAAELKTTFKSHYAREISFAEALRLDMIAQYGSRSTGGKFLLNPQKGLG